MTNFLLSMLVIIYTGWAIYSGYKFLTGRSEWLDRREPASIVVKGILSILVGYVIAAFYLIYLILKLIGLLQR